MDAWEVACAASEGGLAVSSQGTTYYYTVESQEASGTSDSNSPHAVNRNEPGR
jgi:hypothetical protein